MARPAGGGGGGWYGGLATTTTQTTGGVNGGGSGYVYTADTEANYPTPMLVDGAYYLEDASTVNGNTSFASPTGTSEIGHSGNGYVRITVIKVKSGNVFLKESEGAWLEQKQMFVNTGASSTVSSGLVELDYIQSTGNQYINTGITPNGNTRVVFKFAPQDESATQCLFCSRKTTSGTDTYSYTSFYIGAHVRRDYYGTSYLSSDSYSKDTIVTLDANKNVTLINNESCFSSDFTLSSTSSVGPLILLASAYQSSASSALSSLGNYASIKLYSCQIYNNGTLVRNFVPAKRVSDGKCGLWDKVSYRFYVDENGGNFTAGTEKSTIASVGTSIEYIQSSGTQYINTNYIPNTKTKIIADFEVTTKQASNNDIIGVVGQFSFRQYGNADYFRTVSGTAVRDFDTSVSILDRHIVEKTYNFTKVDSYYIQTSASNVTFSYPVYLFAYNTGSSVANQGYLKLYSCKIYDGDTLVRDFIPIKTTVNTYGLWDRVNKVFYKNAGTGTFAGGSFISLSGWRPMKSVWVKTDSNTWEQAL